MLKHGLRLSDGGIAGRRIGGADMSTKFSASFASGGQPQHTHGTIRNGSKMRCGINEGLCVRNSRKDEIRYLFTDGLRNCVQVVFRNDTATFVCHLNESDEVAYWVDWARTEFSKTYGVITYCLVASGDRDDAANQAANSLAGLHVVRKRATGGVAIDIGTGAVGDTPGMGWGPNQADVVGYLTARDCIDLHFTGKRTVGQPGAGDYYENCQVCRLL